MLFIMRTASFLLIVEWQGFYVNFDYMLMFFMQDLCAICTDFIISELWTSNFLAYQVQDASGNRYVLPNSTIYYQSL